MQKPSKDQIEHFHDYGILLPDRVLYLGSENYGYDGNEGGVDALLAERFIKNIQILDSMSNNPIIIIMNNVGGEESHGLAIFDAIKCCKSPVTIKVFGQSMSMGSVILQAADKRLMSPRAVQMIHYGSFGIDVTHTKTAQKWLKNSEESDKLMEQVYLARIKQKNPKFTLTKLKKMLDHDTILTAQESIDLGLADAIIEEKVIE